LIEILWAEPARDLESYLNLEQLAAAPYCDFVYGDPKVAHRVHRALLVAGAGEFASPHGKLAVAADGSVLGMVAGPLRGKRLAQARLAAAAWLRNLPEFVADPGIRARMSLARGALLAVGDDDAYLSRIAVAENARGRGIGRALLQRFEEDARASGARRAVLEVAPQHTRALDLYRRSGFTERTFCEVADPSTGRSLGYHHLVLGLA